MLKNMKKDEKKLLTAQAGFSLVELIVVVAIMAALTAGLAPQYLKYVDRSRKAADENLAKEICTALTIASADEADFLEAKSPYLTIGEEGITMSSQLSTGNASAAAIALQGVFGSDVMTKSKITSNAYKDHGINVNVDGNEENGYTVTWAPATN